MTNTHPNTLLEIIKNTFIPKKKTPEELRLEIELNKFYNIENKYDQNLERGLILKAFFDEFNNNDKYKISISRNNEEAKLYKPKALAILYEKWSLSKESKLTIKKAIFESYKEFLMNEKGMSYKGN